MAKRAKATLEVENLDAVADRGYFDSEEILACEEAGITVTLPKPMTSGINVRGRFGKQDFRYVAEQDVYICPAGERLAYHYTNEEHGLVLRRYWQRPERTSAASQQAVPQGHSQPLPSTFFRRYDASSSSNRRLRHIDTARPTKNASTVPYRTCDPGDPPSLFQFDGGKSPRPSASCRT